MRILLAVNHDLVGCYALNLMLEALAAQHQVAVTVSDMEMLPKGEVHASLLELQALEFTLPRQQLFPLLEKATPDGQGQVLRSFNQCAVHYEVPLGYHRDIRGDDAMGFFRQFQPELILSLRYGAIFREQHIALASKAVWNIHSGLLPAYRGVMPTFRAMQSGLGEYGITMHSVPDARIDAGDVIAMRRAPVQQGMDMLSHVLALYPLARDMVLQCLPALATGDTVPAQAQTQEGQAYYSFPTPQEVTAFEQAGMKIFDMQAYTRFLSQFMPHGVQQQGRQQAA